MKIRTRREVYESKGLCFVCKVRIFTLKDRERIFRLSVEFRNGQKDTFPYATKVTRKWDTFAQEEKVEYKEEQITKEITFCSKCFDAITGGHWNLE